MTNPKYLGLGTFQLHDYETACKMREVLLIVWPDYIIPEPEPTTSERVVLAVALMETIEEED